MVPKDLLYLKQMMGSLDFGEDIKFEPSKLLDRFRKDGSEVNLASLGFNKTLQRFGYRKPQLALVGYHCYSCFPYLHVKIFHTDFSGLIF